MTEFAHAPEGWDTFGTNVDNKCRLEFSKELDHDGFPRWERRVANG